MRTVTCGPVAIGLDGATEQMVAWLAGTFFWELSDEAPVRPTWTVRLDRTEFPPAPSDHEIAGYEFGEKLEVLRLDPLTVRATRTGSTMVVDKIARLAVIDNPEERLRFIDCYRLLRQLIVSELFRSGFHCLHASCVTHDGSGVAFLGEPGAGKTTLMSHLADAGMSVVANDKLFVRDDRHAVHFPEAPGVTVNTLRSLTGWQHRTAAMRRRPLRAAELFLDHPELPSDEELVASAPLRKLYFSEIDYAQLLGVGPHCETRLQAVIEVSRERSEAAHIDKVSTLSLAPYRELLAPFPDWTRTRPEHPVANVGDVQFARLTPAADIEETVNVVRNFLSLLQHAEGGEFE